MSRRLRVVLFVSALLVFGANAIALVIFAPDVQWWYNGLLYNAPLVYSEQTRYQRIDIIENQVFGKCLFLNSQLQLATRDESWYHEALVLPALLTHDDPRKILIVGGGDGGALREVCRFPSVEEITHCEMDPRVPQVVQELIPEVPQGAQSDSRLNLRIGDGRLFLRERARTLGDGARTFDVIIIDLPDPTDTLVANLYTDGFYRDVAANLAPDGILVTQATSPSEYPRAFLAIVDTMRHVFGRVFPYNEDIPSFGLWGYVMASAVYNPRSMPIRELKQRLRTAGIKPRHYHPARHRELFLFNREMSWLLSRTGRPISTSDHPVILYYMLMGLDYLGNRSIYFTQYIGASSLVLLLWIVSGFIGRRRRDPGPKEVDP